MNSRWWIAFGVAMLACGSVLAQDGCGCGCADGCGESEIEVGDGTIPPEEETEDVDEAEPAPQKQPAASEKPRAVEQRGFGFVLPAGWRKLDELPSPTKGREVVLRAVFATPQMAFDAELEVVRYERDPDPRSLPSRLAEQTPAGDRYEFVADPPRTHVFRDKSRGVVVGVDINGHRLRVQYHGATAIFADHEPAILRLAASITTTRAAWPPVPATYRTKKKGPFLVAAHPAVRGSLTPYLKILTAEHKRFRRIHGKLPTWTKKRPLQLVLHATTEATRVYSGNEKIAVNAFFWTPHGRVLGQPFSDEPDQRTLIANARAMLLYVRYGFGRPDWARIGEGVVSMAERHTGRKLPALHPGWLRKYNGLALPRLDRMEHGAPRFQDAAMFYVAYFHAGPSKMRRIYHEYLADRARLGSEPAAFAHAFGETDLDKLREQVTHFIHNRLKPHEPKK